MTPPRTEAAAGRPADQERFRARNMVPEAKYVASMSGMGSSPTFSVRKRVRRSP